jgi:endonuclease-3 related protein
MKNRSSVQRVLLQIFDGLLKYYGPRKWWPAKTRFEVIVGAILAQNVSWKNAKTAVDHLKKKGLLSPPAILSVSQDTIAAEIKTSRFYNQKAANLKAFCFYLQKAYNGSLMKMFSTDPEILREELMQVKGIGKETADSILLYAGKKLSFVSDAYTKRFLARYGHFDGVSTYDQIRDFFMHNLPEDLYLYNEYHALIVHHCNMICKSVPDCKQCPVQSIRDKIFCSYGAKLGI